MNDIPRWARKRQAELARTGETPAIGRALKTAGSGIAGAIRRTKLKQTRKMWMAVIGAAVGLLANHLGPDVLPAPDALVQAIVGVLTAFGVWAVPNEDA